MITIIITAYKEEKTIGRAIEAVMKNRIEEDYEILAVCPDDLTKKVIEHYAGKHPDVKYVRDLGEGKPKALNTAFRAARGDILVLTDGDVYISDDAIPELIQKLNVNGVGAVTGRPISISPRNTMLGYWSHLLTDAGAHLTRLRKDRQGDFMVVSGYLFAMKKLFDKIPEDALAEDAVISHMIWQAGFKIHYAPEAHVFVKYPTTFSDWFLQKRRSAGGYEQISSYFGSNIPRMRTFSREVIDGTFKALSFPQSAKEYLYTLVLFIARLYLWFRIFTDVRLRKLSFHDIWKRIETTK